MKKAKYGIDAPKVILYFLLGGSLAAAFALFAMLFSVLVGAWLFLTGLVFLIEGIWMLYSSLKGKFFVADRALSRLNLKGDEKILDVGCGKGLLLIKSAKQLKSGKAIGIDIWRKQDLSLNQVEKTVENIQLEGVEKQAEVQSGDMREMPFEKDSFDGVVASLAIHNLKEEKDREKALQEIDRVLKPGGKVLIIDFQKMDEYAAFFKKNYHVEVSSKQWQMFPPTRTLIATKIESDCH